MSDQITCAGCRYWRRGQADHAYGAVLRSEMGQCTKVVQFWDATEWDEEGERVPTEGFSNQMSFVQDGSDYHAELLTKPAFYCAHAEPAPPEEPDQ